MNATGRLFAATLIAALGTALLGCEGSNGVAAPDGLQPGFARGGHGGGGGSSLVADVVAGDFTPAPGDAVLATSDCPGSVMKNSGWHMGWHHSGCFIVQPDPWNTATDTAWAPYALTDDVSLLVNSEKQGRNVFILGVKLTGQDVIGDEGIGHNTDLLLLDDPVSPSTNGYTIHVHKANVPVWRTDGHTGGNRVAIIGWISIGDIVVRPE